MCVQQIKILNYYGETNNEFKVTFQSHTNFLKSPTETKYIESVISPTKIAVVSNVCSHWLNIPFLSTLSKGVRCTHSSTKPIHFPSREQKIKATTVPHRGTTTNIYGRVSITGKGWGPFGDTPLLLEGVFFILIAPRLSEGPQYPLCAIEIYGGNWMDLGLLLLEGLPNPFERAVAGIWYYLLEEDGVGQ